MVNPSWLMPYAHLMLGVAVEDTDNFSKDVVILNRVEDEWQEAYRLPLGVAIYLTELPLRDAIPLANPDRGREV